MSIILVRHGETEGNATRVLQPANIPLNALGMQQAERLAERLASLPITHILCSDLPRAQMTAAPVAARLGLPVEYTALLAERNFGDLRGTPYAELTCDPFGPDFAPPNGETWEAFYERVGQAFELIGVRRRQTTGDLLVITHGFVCRALLNRHCKKLDDTELTTFGNTGVSLLDDDDPYHVRLVNCVRHLDGESSGRALGEI